jgi:hypothetical protein
MHHTNQDTSAWVSKQEHNNVLHHYQKTLKENEELRRALAQKQQQCMHHTNQDTAWVSKQEHNNVLHYYQTTLQENEELKLQLKGKDDDIKRLHSLLHVHDSEKRSVQYSHDHEAIQLEFRSYCDHMEFDVPKSLQLRDSSKKKFSKYCCKLYQTSFDICRKEIYKMFDKTLTSIVQLSEEEEQGEVNFDRRKKLKDATTAYQYLLKQCEVQLNRVDKTSLVAKLAKEIKLSQEWIPEANTAVEICWKMLTVSPPMFLCQPTKYNAMWHVTHARSWHEPPGELIYYRPVLMYGAGGTVAYKGFVGSEPVFSHDNAAAVSDDHQEKLEGIKCSVCQQDVNNEFNVIGIHCYHPDCFTCNRCTKTLTHDNIESSQNGRILWCNDCYQQLLSCRYCHIAINHGEYCKSCYNKYKSKICFECNKKIERREMSTTNCGIFHKNCICDCQGARAVEGDICKRCKKKIF